MIARGVEGGHLLQHQRLALLDVGFELLPYVSRFLDGAAANLERLPAEKRLGSRRLGDVNIRLASAHQQVHAILANDFARERLQVFVVELAVQLRARVDDASVDGRTHSHAC